MGLLTVGEPLSWPETKAHAEHVRAHGIQQFLNIYKARKHRKDDVLKWGDEIEYIVVKFDRAARKVRLSIRASTEVLKVLQIPEESGQADLASLWRPEFAAYMVEGTPGMPYGILPTAVERALKLEANSSQDNIRAFNQIVLDGGEEETDSSTSSGSRDHSPVNGNGQEHLINPKTMFAFLNAIEVNMRYRRDEVQALLAEDEAVLSISVFPRSGTFDSCFPAAFVETVDGYSRSLFFPDQAINHGHPRFRTLSQHICDRRGTPPNIQLPIYRDVNTQAPFIENFFDSMNLDRASLSPEALDTFRKIADQREAQFRKEDHVYMDAMGFGMGCCCLQVTFQAHNVCEARMLYDQLTPLCPILMALSAASPAFRGYLTDVDCRWAVISGSVDDRTEAELTGVDPTTGDPCRRIPKSRFDSVDLYIYPGNEVYNDIPVCIDQRYYDQLIGEGVDPLLARHIAHLFIRDPLVLFKEKINIDDTKESDHFENIQSTNWQTMRFKPPPANTPEIGWRVEFRPMEVQLTDSENAAFVVFIVLITRLILSFNLDLLIPMSKVEENMKEGQKRDAASKGKFWFRRDITLPQCVVNHFARFKPDCKAVCRLSKQLSPCNKKTPSPCTSESLYTSCMQLSINEIINGTNGHDTNGSNGAGSGSDSETNGHDPNGNSFPGLIPLLNFYLDSMEIDAETRCTLSHYLAIIARRARGEVPTPAHIIRNYITAHPDYRQDSVVNESICYDLLSQLAALQADKMTLPELLQSIRTMQKAKKTQ